MFVNAFEKAFSRIKYELSTGARPRLRKNLKLPDHKRMTVSDMSFIKSGRQLFYSIHSYLRLSVLCWNRVARKSKKLSLKSNSLESGMAKFEIMFKCMSGFTTEVGKFIMPLEEKLSFENSFDRCDRFGFTNDF